jgi:hypothetical protein
MPQNPLAAAVAQNPSNALALLKVDPDGNLIVTSAPDGNAVTIGDGDDVTQGAKADAAIVDPTATASVVSVLKGILTRSTGAYETVAASQTAQVLGATGATGDYLQEIIIIPATAAAGAVTILDGSRAISLFAGGGTTALTDLRPITVRIGAVSQTGPWKVTTGANVSVIGVGNFT